MSQLELLGIDLYYHNLIEYSINDIGVPEQKYSFLKKSFLELNDKYESFDLMIRYLDFIDEFCAMDPQIASNSFLELKDMISNSIQLMAVILIVERTQSTIVTDEQIEFIDSISINLLANYFSNDQIYGQKIEVIQGVFVEKQYLAFIFHLFSSLIKDFGQTHYRAVDLFTFHRHLMGNYFPTVSVIKPIASDYIMLLKKIDKNGFIEMEDFLVIKSAIFGEENILKLYDFFGVSPKNAQIKESISSLNNKPILESIHPKKTFFNSTPKPMIKSFSSKKTIRIPTGSNPSHKSLNSGRRGIANKSLSVKSQSPQNFIKLPHINIEKNYRDEQNNYIFQCYELNSKASFISFECKDNPYKFHSAVCKILSSNQIYPTIQVSISELPIKNKSVTNEIEALVSEIEKFDNLKAVLDYMPDSLDHKIFLTIVVYFILTRDNLENIYDLFDHSLFVCFSYLVQKLFMNLTESYKILINKMTKNEKSNTIKNKEITKYLKDIFGKKDTIAQTPFFLIQKIFLYNCNMIEEIDDNFLLYASLDTVTQRCCSPAILYAYAKKDFIFNHKKLSGKAAKIIGSTKYLSNREEFVCKLIKRASFDTKYLIWEKLNKHMTINSISKEMQAYFALMSDNKWSEQKATNYLDSLKSEPFMTTDKIERREKMFKKFKNQFFKIVSNNSRYSGFAPAFSNILTYDEREKYLPKIKRIHPISMNIDREKIIEDSMKYIKTNGFQRRFKCQYKSEKGIDQGGLRRDWFDSVWNELENTVFCPTPGGRTLMFNPEYGNEKIIKFAGKFIAGVIIQKAKIGANLCSFIYKSILSIDPNLDDVNDYDKSIWNTLNWILCNDVKFSYLTYVFGENELIPNGMNIDVTEKNKKEYVNLVIKHVFSSNQLHHVKLFCKGFYKVIPEDKILLSVKELKKLIYGENRISVGDWKAYTIEENQVETEHFQMFFDILSKWNQKSLRKLLRFCTGSSQLPIGGFKYLSKYGGTFRIIWNCVSDRLPVAHTCFNILEIPLYETKEIMEAKLELAIECTDFGVI